MSEILFLALIGEFPWLMAMIIFAAMILGVLVGDRGLNRYLRSRAEQGQGRLIGFAEMALGMAICFAGPFFARLI